MVVIFCFHPRRRHASRILCIGAISRFWISVASPMRTGVFSCVLHRTPATLLPEALGPTLPEPHASWVEAIEEEWERRYGS